MKCTTLPLVMQLPDEPFAFSLQALVARLHTVPDLRASRGIRYPLPVVLTVTVLAKLVENHNHSGCSRQDVRDFTSRLSKALLRSEDLTPIIITATSPHGQTYMDKPTQS